MNRVNGFYIQTRYNTGKAEQIATMYDGRVIEWIPFDAIPEGKALICCIGNGSWEAAAFMFDKQEYNEFHEEGDTRPRSYALITWDEAVESTGFKERGGVVSD